jgi:hypothetical protein
LPGTERRGLGGYPAPFPFFAQIEIRERESRSRDTPKTLARKVVPCWPSADLRPLKRQGRRADSDSNSWLGTDGNQLGPGASEKGAADDAALSLRKIETSLARGFDRANTKGKIPKGRRFAAAGVSAKRPCGGSEIGS